jgi:hypothetical protein
MACKVLQAIMNRLRATAGSGIRASALGQQMGLTINCLELGSLATTFSIVTLFFNLPKKGEASSQR